VLLSKLICNKKTKGWFKERWKQLDSVRRKRGIGKKLLAEVW
jgi:hypothetical protein